MPSDITSLADRRARLAQERLARGAPPADEVRLMRLAGVWWLEAAGERVPILRAMAVVLGGWLRGCDLQAAEALIAGIEAKELAGTTQAPEGEA